MTARRMDVNGWIEIKGNPISKAGVFPYRGDQVSDEFPPDKIVWVLRPEEELSSQETIESFKLQPLINEHTMLGNSDDGLTPAEVKGVEGVIGEEVFYDAPYLKANLKIFSDSLMEEINSGKLDLSCGYRCVYEITPGVWNGIHYDAVQRKMRGNHVAIVDVGRMGPEVRVLDHFRFTVDNKDVFKMNEELLTALKAAITALESGEQLSPDACQGLSKMFGDMCAPMRDEVSIEVEKKEEPEMAPVEPAPAESAPLEKKEGQDSSIDLIVARVFEKVKQTYPQRPAMDAKSFMAEAAKKSKLADRLSNVVGAFDSAEMTHQEVAEYGCSKIGLSFKGREAIAALDAYLVAHEMRDKPVFVSPDQKKAGLKTLEDYFSKG